VTKSDIEIWRQHIAPVPGASRARLVVLNKIDGLWDELKTPAEIDAEIAKQVASSASLLELPPSQVYPVSARRRWSPRCAAMMPCWRGAACPSWKPR